MAHISTDSRCYNRPQRLGLWARISVMLGLRRQRLDLANLDDHLLRDVGLTRDEARKEVNRPPWDVPDTWRN